MRARHAIEWTRVVVHHVSLAGLAALAAAAGVGCRSAPASQAEARPAKGEIWLSSQQIQDARVKLAAVEPRREDDELAVTGKVAFDDLRVSHVFSPVTGKVTRILADPGQPVKKGTALAAIQSPDVGIAVADLGKARAELLAAERDFRRQRELYDAHAGSERELEAAQDSSR